MPVPLLFTRDGKNVLLGDMYRGGHAFLVCGGPSLTTHDLTLLQQRGIVTCAVNNAATIVRSNVWVSVDDPGNFSDVIWRDPGILKFIPLDHMEKAFTSRDDAGELVTSKELVGDMPTVFGFRRNEAFVAEQFLYEGTFNWGNHGKCTDAYGYRGCRSVMLVALRLLFHLGIRTVYLLGCDFKMRHGAANYAFEQERSRASVRGNNKTFEALDTRFRHLLPYFERESFRVFNCTPESGLTAFPKLEYEEAVTSAVSAMPRAINTRGMYDRKQKNSANSSFNEESSVTTAPPVGITLFTTVDASNQHLLSSTWRTWMKFHPWLRTVPAFVLYSPDVQESALRSQLSDSCDSLTLLEWPVVSDRPGRDRWAEAWLTFPSQHVDTPWFIKIDPEAIASRSSAWAKHSWFEPQPTGTETALIAHAWGYSKPANALKRLDDWADSTPMFRDFPRLDAPMDESTDRVCHATISSWLYVGNTAWTRQMSSAVDATLPCPSFDTFVSFCAARRRDHFIRCSMKEFGWEHSFQGHQKIEQRCRALLESTT